MTQINVNIFTLQQCQGRRWRNDRKTKYVTHFTSIPSGIRLSQCNFMQP